MNNLLLLCGKPGCGKTTLANYLKTKYKIIHFSADDFMLKLFGEINNRELFNEKLKACKEKIYELTEELLTNDVDVVLDFGFWTREERQTLKERFKKFNVVLVYLKLDNETIFQRIESRNSNLKTNEYYMDKDTFEFLSLMFEEPIEDERCILYNSIEELENRLKTYNLVKK